MDAGDKFVILCMVVALLFVVVLHGFFPEKSGAYAKGVKDTHKEAYEHGLMEKEITKDDKVIYRWKELHKIGEEYERY